MFDIHRLTIGSGQSYQDISMLTADEISSLEHPIFGIDTYAFVWGERFLQGHADNISVLHLTKLAHPVLDDSVPYEKIVLANDSIYGPGQFYMCHHLVLFGLAPFVSPKSSYFTPFLFSTPREGLLMVNVQTIVSVESQASRSRSSMGRMVPQKL